MSATSSSEKFPPQLEAQLLAAAARIFRTDFPNAERAGCPPRQTLEAVVRKATSNIESRNVVDHLTCCSPCFAEYERLIRRGVHGLRIPEPTVVQKEPLPRQAVPNEFEMAVLDLRNQSPVRGDQQPAPSKDSASLPTRRLELTVYLPIGSEEGGYEMQILREAGTPLVTQKGTAALEDHNVVLRIRADLTGLDSGRYLLRLRRASYSWRYYPVALTP
jgi:hypothetical protein